MSITLSIIHVYGPTDSDVDRTRDAVADGDGRRDAIEYALTLIR
ncbi:hypothetical protein [Natrinema hispanicum]|nr:hypothetical protein [Natrinema hispanicum]